MVLLNALVTDLVFETLRFILLAGCMVGGVFVGKKLKEASNAKKSANENEQ